MLTWYARPRRDSRTDSLHRVGVGVTKFNTEDSPGTLVIFEYQRAGEERIVYADGTGITVAVAHHFTTEFWCDVGAAKAGLEICHGAPVSRNLRNPCASFQTSLDNEIEGDLKRLTEIREIGEMSDLTLQP